MKKFLSLIIIFIVIQPGSTIFAQSQQPQSAYMSKQWSDKANSMVKYQIEKRGLTNEKVLNVMRNTPRHLFVPPALSTMAYDDYPIPIGEEQTISQPYIVALMTDLLNLKGDEKILEIGTGSGYQAAVLSQLVDSVYTIEIIESLANNAKKRLDNLNYNNVIVKHGDGYKGWPSVAPFDAIIVTAAPEEVPQTLINQLKVGGCIVIPVGDKWQELQLIIKIEENKTKKKTVIPVRFVPMIHPTE
ncbi:MAG: protein-L-isoaspartate(D-aspartate) O-methyltransferase [Candidatus Marinimicrobia bacterium]|nr:protein-L-isoaspartate(D-aspartate) O-methyltransferase [Candidatus Neomarinimicrobiota bacterium]